MACHHSKTGLGVQKVKKVAYEKNEKVYKHF